ncbi:BZ3500_MvSof-1268-A1-R1_Chr10-4g03094 [Microbotryum saponariae]|uniref:BZ3500_MvSof-1268-A1-R1_Chr10-4g03094 protein n=1 Tax=Microbotryum saponariae TaxID=289078 RepID=A0A2X0N7H6_9BASI|nr:BZ3500_MvSof-1268-A1-R1_Chr10-4g03094 [Microbotryum saponariae]
MTNVKATPKLYLYELYGVKGTPAERLKSFFRRLASIEERRRERVSALTETHNDQQRLLALVDIVNGPRFNPREAGDRLELVDAEDTGGGLAQAYLRVLPCTREQALAWSSDFERDSPVSGVLEPLFRAEVEHLPTGEGLVRVYVGYTTRSPTKRAVEDARTIERGRPQTKFQHFMELSGTELDSDIAVYRIKLSGPLSEARRRRLASSLEAFIISLLGPVCLNSASGGFKTSRWGPNPSNTDLFDIRRAVETLLGPSLRSNRPVSEPSVAAFWSAIRAHFEDERADFGRGLVPDSRGTIPGDYVAEQTVLAASFGRDGFDRPTVVRVLEAPPRRRFLRTSLAFAFDVDEASLEATPLTPFDRQRGAADAQRFSLARIGLVDILALPNPNRLAESLAFLRRILVNVVPCPVLVVTGAKAYELVTRFLYRVKIASSVARDAFAGLDSSKLQPDMVEVPQLRPWASLGPELFTELVGTTRVVEIAPSIWRLVVVQIHPGAFAYEPNIAPPRQHLAKKVARPGQLSPLSGKKFGERSQHKHAMPDPPGADGPPPEDLLGGNGASDSSLNTQTREAVTGGTANPPAWSPKATQVRLDHEKLMKKTFQVLGIVPSSKSTRRLMVLMHDASTPPSQAPALARAAQRAVRNDAAPASNVIRVIMDGPGSPRGPVQTALRKHFGLAETPFMFARPEGVVLDPEVEKLFSKCVKLNPIVTKATKRFPIARHMYELVFESEQACLEAASAGPFPYHGKEMVTELPSASPLNHVVQVRFTLPSSSSAIPASVLRKSLDDAITLSFGRAGRTQGYTLMQLQRGLAVDPNGDPMAMTEDGFHCAYLRLHADLFQGSIETQKAALNAALPQEIEILGAKYGLRHEFETHYCAVCDRAGHQWGACRKPVSTPATAAPVPGASTSTSTSTTGFRVAGKNGKHGGPAALNSRVSGANMIQLGPRANPAGAVTANKDDANDGDDEPVVSTEPEGGDTGEETSTRATLGSTKETQTTTAAPVSTPTSPSPLSGGTSGSSATSTTSIASTSPRRLRSSSAPGNRRVTRAGSAMILGASGGDGSGGNSSGGHRSESLTVLTFNVRSMKNAVNQVKIIRYLKTLRPAPAAILLQEHHLSYNASREGFESAWPGACIRFTPHVLTLIPDGSPLAGHLLSSTPVVFAGAPRFDGRILRSVFRLEELDVEIINMYAPVQEDDRRDFFGLLHFNAPRPKILRILAGDLNDCPDVSVDRVSITDRAWTPVSHWQTLLSKIAFKALDTVRHVHPCTPAFTRPHYRGRGEERKICSWSRIDYILVQCSWANRLLSASTLFDAPCSDHRPVVATFALPTSNADAEPPLSLPSTSDFISRLNPMVFDDQDFVASIPGVVDEVYRRLEGTAPLGDVYDAALRAVAVAGHARYRSTRADMRRLRAESQSVMEALEARGEHMNEAERDAYALAKSRLDQLAVKEAQWLRIRAHVPSVDSREGQSASIRTRLNRRSRQTSIVSLEDVDGTETVDMQEALGIASRHAQSLFTPDPARGDPTNARRSLLDPIRAAKCYDDDRSDPTFGRRLPRQARVALDEPFTLLEVEAALKKTDSGRSPGPSGIPYELFKALPTYFAPKLLDLFNSIWEGGKMTASLAEGLVRLLPKNKPGANLKSLGAYRPITLRETTYKVLSKVLVARLNGVLGELLPPAQHGFMPSRRSADAGSHLTLLLEKLKSLGTDVFPEGALLSLDQQSAYDRVDHAWIFEVFEAFGFGERFISLLRALYDPKTLGVRYLVNGFPTDLVRLLCGLGQGDPLSCPVWNITFQPFLDALVRRGIALDLQKVWPGGPRAQLTHLAFADDAVVVVESPAALSKLQTLSQTWYEATNGKTNTDKTLVLPLGPNWLRDETAQALPTVQEGESFKWCGYAFFRHGDSKLFWTHVLDRIKAKTRAARDRTLSPSGKVFYANAHIISTVLHVLSFDIPPQWFIKAAETALTDFVWGGAGRNTVARDFVFQAREDGGLGLISIGDIVHSVALRFWDAVAGSDEAIWAPLARESWRSLVAATRDFSPWGFFSSTARVEKLYRDSTRWGAVVAAARVTVPTIKSELLTLPELLSLPPRLPSLYAEGAQHAYDDADAVAKFAQIADLYWRDEGKGWALVGHRRGFWQHSKEPALQHEHVWSRVGQLLKAKALLPKTALRPARIPLKEAPRPRCFNFFGLSRPFTIRKLRRLVNKVRFPGREDRVKRLPDGTSQSDRKRFWRWLHDRFASAVEQDTHWRLMYDVTPTRKRQHTQGHASSPTCLFCGNDAAVIETVSHYFFECAYSTSFWGGVLRILLDKLGIEDTDVDPSTFTPEQLTMGLPLLRGRGRTTSKWMWVRLACAIGFQRLHLLRWRVHQRFELDNVVAPPSLPSALRAFERDFLSRAGFVPGVRDWEWKAAHLSLSLLCAVAIFVLGWIGKPGRSSLRWRLYRSFALVKIYGMDREERSLVFLPALETQPREDIRRCRGDE